MHSNLKIIVCTVVLMLAGLAPSAHADWEDDRYDPTRIYGGLWLGFGGDIETKGLGQTGNLGKTIGGQAGVDVIVARYLSLGGEVRIGGMDIDGYDDRSRLIDLDFKPRLRLPIRRSPLELYATVPVGLTIPRLADADDRGGVDENIGWNVGVGGGLNVFVTHRVALNVEPIWLIHHFGVDGTDGNGNVKVKQFAILLNAVIAL